MSHITLVRHGQANSAARTEGSYDKLSPLGRQQSEWLGTHLRDNQQHHARLYCGTLRRHRETAEAMAMDLDCIEDPRLNELQYFSMAKALEIQQGVPAPVDVKDFVTHFPQLMQAWMEDKIEGAPERFGEFEARTQAVLQEIGSGEGPALIVTSGGIHRDGDAPAP